MTLEQIEMLVQDAARLNDQLVPRTTSQGKPYTTPEWRLAIQIRRIWLQNFKEASS